MKQVEMYCTRFNVILRCNNVCKRKYIMENCNEYLLMNKDIEIMKFISETNEFNEVLLEQMNESENLLPIAFGDIHSFISNRQAPKHRAHIQKLLIHIG